MKCSTHYVLEDGLLPPGGAPVQCTKCGLVFSAKPSDAVMVQAKAPARVTSEVPVVPAVARDYDDSKTVQMVMPAAITESDSGHVSRVMSPRPPVTADVAPHLPPVPPTLPDMQSGSTPIRATVTGPYAAYERPRSKVWLILGGLLIIAVGTWGTLRFLKWRQGTPVAVVLAKEAALIRLMRDDTESREQAVELLEGIASANPRYVEAQAAILIATSWAMDDARLVVRRLDSQLDVLNRDLRELETFQTAINWQTRAEGLREEMKELSSQKTEALKTAERWAQKASKSLAALDALQEMPTPEAEQSRALARALHWAVKGSRQAVDAIEAYRRFPTAQVDGWADIIEAEFRANAKVSQEDIANSRQAMKSLRQREATHLRAYVLEARCAMATSDFEEARNVLDQLLLLNSNHETGKLLIEWLGDIEKGTAGGMPLFVMP